MASYFKSRLLRNLELLADGETMGVAHAVGLLDRVDRDSIIAGDLGERLAGRDVILFPSHDWILPDCLPIII